MTATIALVGASPAMAEIEVTTDGPWPQLAGQYIRGTEMSNYGIDVCFTRQPGDPVVDEIGWEEYTEGGGVEGGGSEATSGLSDCIATSGVAPGFLGEGAHHYRGYVGGPSGRPDGSRDSVRSEPWTVYIDRTPPGTPAGFALDYFNPQSHDGTIAWDTVADPLLPDGSRGAGIASVEVRFKVNAGAFSAWQTAAADVVDVTGNAGDYVTVEVRATDVAGNVSATGTGSVQLAFMLEDPEVAEDAAEWYADEYATTLPVARAWMDIQSRTEGVGDEIAAGSSGPGYAGVWFDNTNRRFKVNLKLGTSSSAAQTAITARGLASHTDIVSTPNTQAELEAAQPDVEDDIADLIDAGLVRVSRSNATNSIEIEVAAPATTAQRTRIANAAASVAVQVNIVNSTESSFIEEITECTDTLPAGCDAPFRGGIKISTNAVRDHGVNQGLQGAGCTAGFIVRLQSTGVLHVMTAGHCLYGFPLGATPWLWTVGDNEEPGYPLGTSKSPFVYGEGGDAGLIGLDTYDDQNSLTELEPWIFRRTSPNRARNAHYRIRGSAHNAEGRTICAAGAFGGSRCGAIPRKGLNVTTTVDEDLRPGSANVKSRTVKHMGRIISCGFVSGDSGAPIVRDGMAVGLMASGSGCTWHFQGARTAEDRLLVRIWNGKN